MFQGEIVVGFILWGTQVCTSLLRRCLDIYIRYGGTRGKVRGLPKSAGVVLGNIEVCVKSIHQIFVEIFQPGSKLSDRITLPSLEPMAMTIKAHIFVDRDVE